MGSIPLPALSIRPPQQQENPLQQYGQLMQLKQSIANAPLQRQAMEQQVQQGQQSLQSGHLQLQQQQQAEKDQQAFRQVFSDPAFHGKTISDIADHLAERGQISQGSYQAAKKADLEQRQTLATLDKDQLANADAAHKQTQQIYDAAMGMSDQELAQNWPAIAQQYDQIPGNTKAPLNPQQPLTKQQLQQFGPMLSMQGTYLAEQVEKHKKQSDADEAASKAALAATVAERGGTSESDKFVSDYLKSHGMANTPENRQVGYKEYTKETKIEPAQVRASTYLQMPQAIVDPNDASRTIYTTRAKAVGQEAPGSGEAVAARAAAGAGVKADAQSLAKLQTNFDQVSAFENTAKKNIDLLQETAKNIPDLGARFANVPVRMLNDKMLGTPQMAAFKTALNTAQTEAAKVLNSSNASGVLSDSARHELQEVVDGNMSYPAMVASLNTLKQDMSNRHQAYKDQITEIRGRLNPGQQAPAPARPQGVPENAEWNPQGHNGAGSWQIK